MSVDAYNTLTSARATAATLGLSRITSATDAALTAALMLACIDVDSAMRYQGRKYDSTGAITGTVQVREFPRWVSSSGFSRFPYPPEGGTTYGYPPEGGTTCEIWDWDTTTNTPVVPPAVLMAEVIQADSILAGDRDARLQAIADGLRGQQVGQQHEQYELGMAPSQLCLRAAAMMKRYRLRSGALL